MDSLPIIRPVQPKDFAQLLALARVVATENDAFAWGDLCSSGEEGILSEMWIPDQSQARPKHRETFVCEIEGYNGIVGAYTLQPNDLPRCSHIAKCAYMVAPDARGHGLGKQLCAHSLREGRRHRYTGVHLDMVVSTNIPAIKVFSSCGFKLMCTLPKVFRHAVEGLVDAHTMFHDFNGSESDRSRRTSFASVEFANASTNYKFMIGDEINLRLQPVPSFTIQPPLPEGVSFCSSTGVIHGVPLRSCPEITYQIVAGEARFQVSERVSNSEASVCINEAFAAQLENIIDVRDMPKEPLRIRAYGDWMIWMVHRAWLNDPTLVELNFTNMHMPEPNIEPRIAPKLMKAMETNTYIQVLSLSNANVQKLQGIELANALRMNCTVKTLNLESNCLDSISVRQLALSIRDNGASTIEQLRVSHQRQMGNLFFGRPAEEAVGMMMQRNMTIVKLGFECDDAHWRNEIDRALVRNNDKLRRTLQGTSSDADHAGYDEEKTLGQIKLQEVPSMEVSPHDFFHEGNDHRAILRSYMAQNLQLPTPQQLQHYAKSVGSVIPYTSTAPLIRACRSWLLENAVGNGAIVVDAFGVASEGTLNSWQESNERWNVDVGTLVGTRLNFKSDREPLLFLSNNWSPWLGSTKRRSRGGA